ncbi:MAG: ATP-binding protein [Candidatus Spyradocola sp.]
MQRSARFVSNLKKSLVTLGILLGEILFGFGFSALGLLEINIYTVFILGILVSAVITADVFFSALSCVGGVFLFNFLFAEPRFSVQAANFGYPVDFLLLMSAALLVGSLSHANERMSFRTRTLLATDQLFLKASGADQIVSIAAEQLRSLLGRPLVYLPANDGAPQFFGPGKRCAADEDAVRWTLKTGDPAGAHTLLHPSARYTYIAVRTADHTFGAMGIDAGKRPLTDMERELMRSLLSECALTLERDYYNRLHEEESVRARNEQLRATLLRSISHDLRTPLTGILGNASLLCDTARDLTDAQRAKLARDIQSDAQWLLGTVENVLSVTRMEEGRMALQLRPELIAEVLSEAAARAQKLAPDHIITLEPPDDLLMARIDARLVMQVVLNLLDNAAKYTPAGAYITLRATPRDDRVVVEVADDGPGIPEENKPRVFELFYTTSTGAIDGRRGLGLGLALCRAIVTAHGGELTLRDNTPHGAIFAFTLRRETINLPS